MRRSSCWAGGSSRFLARSPQRAAISSTKASLRGWFTTGRNGSRLAASENVLLDDRVDAPVAVNHLGDAEVDADCDQRDCLILRQLLSCHQEPAHLAERIAQGEIDRRFRVDIGLRLGSALVEGIGTAESVQQPLVLSL